MARLSIPSLLTAAILLLSQRSVAPGSDARRVQKSKKPNRNDQNKLVGVKRGRKIPAKEEVPGGGEEPPEELEAGERVKKVQKTEEESAPAPRAEAPPAPVAQEEVQAPAPVPQQPEEEPLPPMQQSTLFAVSQRFTEQQLGQMPHFITTVQYLYTLMKPQMDAQADAPGGSRELPG